ncbi:MAG: 5'-nucleotidase C-terminal domain-containing protein [Woeseiaceae bacterium]
MKASKYRLIVLNFLTPACLILAACATVPAPASRDSEGLTFIHLNDTYRVGTVEEGSKGGLGRVVTVIRELQRQGRDIRVLHGGDFLYPSLESQIWDGQQMIEAFNHIDAVAPMYLVAGNHESDRRTPEQLVNAVRASHFDWLGDNYRFATGQADVDAALKRKFTYQHGDKTVGVFALTLHPADDGNDRTYLPVDRDYIGIAKRIIDEFEAQKVDLIIGLTHLHIWLDHEIAGLRKYHPKLAFIVGGHEHEPQYKAQTEDSAAVMKGASNARVIWQIDVTFDASGLPVVTEQQLDMDTSVAVDVDYARIDARWRDQLLQLYPFLESRVGTAALPMNATEEVIRNGENSWGNFIVDQMPGAFGEPAADFAFINSGSLRIDDFIADDILFEDIARTFGFSSHLRHLTVSGAEFRQLLEVGFRSNLPSKGYFPQVSGFRMCVDRGRPVGERIISLQVPADDGWQEIDATAEYTLVIPDFVFKGGDGYMVPEQRKRTASRPGSELKYLVLDAIVRAHAEGRAVGEAVDPANPRIEILDAAQTACFSQ